MSWLVLDASRYQTFNDYSAAAADIDGVILRCGLRGYNTGTLSKDSKLDSHYNAFYGKQAKGGISIRLGYYWYTCAISEAEAIEEGEYVQNLLHTKANDFPVYIVSEYGSDELDGRADQLGAEERTQYIVALADKLKSYGYRVGVYATQDWFTNNLIYETLVRENLHIWIANEEEPELTDYEAWRYTAAGTIGGIITRVSLSNFYEDVANWANTQININTLESWIVSPVTYNGTMVTPTTVGIEGLVYMTDYTVQWCNAAAASSLAYALLEGRSNYTGSKSLPYVIEPANINVLGIQLVQDGYKYTGEEIKPKIKYDITTDLGNAFSTSQYTIEYFDNIYPGEGTVRVKGKNNFTGTLDLHFYIEGRVPFPSSPYLEGNNFIYTGSVIRPKVYIDDLEEGTDFIVSYADNLNCGKAKVYIKGKGNYEGEDRDLFFTINPLDLTNTTNVRFSGSSFPYTGDPIRPSFTISATYGDIIYKLDEGIDYTYRYTNNIDIGRAALVVQGYGNYTGEHYAYYNIVQASISDCDVSLESDKYEYTGSPIEPEVIVIYKGERISPNDYTVVYNNNIKVSKAASVTVNGRNNLTGTYKLTFEITTKTGSDYWILDETEFVYTGYQIKPTPICMTDDPVPGKDYTVTYENNIYAGTAKCVVEMIGNYSYKRVYLTFTILKRPLIEDVFSLEQLEYDYTGDYIKPRVICSNTAYKEGVEYSVEYHDNKYPDGDAHALVQGITNYEGSVKLDFNIFRINISKTAHIDMGEPVKYNVYDPKNFAVIDDNGETLTIYDDYIYDFKTITFEKNTSYNYTVYIVTGIGPYTGTIVKGYRTSIDRMEPYIPGYVNVDETEIIDEPIDPEEIPTEEDSEESASEIIVTPTYVDPNAKTEKFIENVKPIIPKDPDDVEYHSGQYVYLRRCKYYDSAYAKYPMHELQNGTLYVYKYNVVNNRIRITLDSRNAKIIGRTTGWIDLADIKDIYQVKLGEKVRVEYYIWYDRNNLEGRIFFKDQDLYVSYIDPKLRSTSDVAIGLSRRPNTGTIGWASIDMLNFYEITEYDKTLIYQ